MHKKIISLILSVVLVVSVFSSMNVLAAQATRQTLYEEDFENFSTKSFNSAFNASGTSYAVADETETSRLSVGVFFKTDIVEMTGYDGNTTEAVKITANNNASNWTTSAGAGRITLSGLQAQVEAVTSGTLVYEYKLYVPSDVNSGGETISQSISTFYMSPIVKAGDYYGVGTSYDNSKKSNIDTLTKGEWHKFTYVLLLDESRVLVYHNDKLVSYKVREVASKGYRFQLPYKPSTEGSHLIFDDFKVWHIAGSASLTAATTAASSLNGAVDVSRFVKPTVTFSEQLLDEVTDSGATVSKDNVVMTTSDGAPVEIDSVSLSADGKTLTIDPAPELGYSTLYRVTVKNLLNLYQEKIADYQFSFTVMDEPPFAASEPVFVKEDLGTKYSSGTEITSLEDGYIRASYSLTNNHDTDTKDAFMFAILRDGKKLSAIQYKEISVAARETVSFDVGFTVDDYNNQSIEIYIWDSLSGKSALASSYTISKDGITSSLNE